MDEAHSNVTRLLRQWSGGDQGALEELIPLVYGELRRLARGYVAREKPGQTLQPTALVHEAFMRLCGWKSADWKDRQHFYAAAARLMRNVLVDQARARNYVKRGGKMERLSIEDVALASGEAGADLVALDEALGRLEQVDHRKSRTVELAYFGGFTTEEISQVLEVSPSTVVRDLRFAKSWLHRDMTEQGAG